MKMYSSSNKYRDACDSGKEIYSSFYRTLLLLNKVQLKQININKYFEQKDIKHFVLYGCNDVTEIFYALCKKNRKKPDYIIENNIKKYKGLYPDIDLSNNVETDEEIDCFIVMSNYNFNRIAKEMNDKGVPFQQIISIEELLAGMLCEVED